MSGTHEFTVAQFLEFLNDAMRTIVDPARVAVVGEVAEYKVSQGKWVWFKVKDESGEGILECFWTTFQMNTELEDGMKVRLYGYPRIHPRSGKFSFNVIRAEPVGEGALRRAYELLKKKLTEEGLFAVERKRAIPRIPETIGLITSPEAAAYTDFLRILNNRWGGLRIILTPVAVQGERASKEIVGAFEYFNRLPPEEQPDVLVLTRGGGSMEDLQAFNSEEVARAVFRSKIPVVCGVGHERDESLADFVADVRASTPSNAAERVVPDRREVRAEIDFFTRNMERELDRRIRGLESGVRHSLGRMERFFMRQRERCAILEERMERAYPRFRMKLARLEEKAVEAMRRVERRFADERARLRERIRAGERLIANMNPELQFRRGWSVVRGPDGKVLKDAAKVDIGALVAVRLWHGSLGAEVRRKDGTEQGKLL